MPHAPALASLQQTPSRKIRLLAVGDCNTAGALGSGDEDRVAAQLAARLEAAGWTCTEQNLGYTMSTTREGVARMRRDARPADLLLLNFGLVDAWVTTIPQIYVPYYPDGNFKRFSRKLLKSLKRRLRTPRLRRFIPVGEVVPIEEYQYNMRRIIDIARDNNPDVRILLWGTVPVIGDAERSRNIARYNVRLREIANSEPHTWYYETTTALQGLSPDDAYLDHFHIAKSAADRIAEEMMEICLTRMQLGATIRDLQNAA